ncbi:MAG: hypothetical protein ACRDOO_22580 [Actinomadura sp.]
MSKNDVWIRDISMLRQLGISQMDSIATDLRTCSGVVDALSLDLAAFGDNDMRDETAQAYETARDTIAAQINSAHQGMDSSAQAIVAIANHYTELEERMSD